MLENTMITQTSQEDEASVECDMAGEGDTVVVYDAKKRSNRRSNTALQIKE